MMPRLIYLFFRSLWSRQIATAQDHHNESDQASYNSEEESSNYSASRGNCRIMIVVVRFGLDGR